MRTIKNRDIHKIVSESLIFDSIINISMYNVQWVYEYINE